MSSIFEKWSSVKKPTLEPGSVLDVSGGYGYVTTHSGENRGTHVHYGIDIAGIAQGSEIKSRVSGVIEDVREDWTNKTMGGTVVVVRGDDGRTYTYAHISGLISKKGDKIEKGQAIAKAGGAVGRAGSGSSTTGTHIHEAVKETSTGRHIDPETGRYYEQTQEHRKTSYAPTGQRFAAERGLKQDSRTREETPDKIIETETHRQASIFGGKPGQKSNKIQHIEDGQTREKTPTEAVILFTEDLSEAQMDLQQSGSNFANWAGELLRERKWYEFGRA